MNNFRKQLTQSQVDGSLPIWELAYQKYWKNYERHTDTYQLSTAMAFQKDGADHIVEVSETDRYKFVDMMFVEKKYDNLFIEISVDGRPGKFRQNHALCTHIAYGFRPSPVVCVFEYQECCSMIDQWLMDKLPIRSCQSTELGRNWVSKGIIVPISKMENEMASFRAIHTWVQT